MFYFFPNRCGGQGDLLSGTLALFLYWATRNSMECPDPGLLLITATKKMSILFFIHILLKLIKSNLITQISRFLTNDAFFRVAVENENIFSLGFQFFKVKIFLSTSRSRSHRRVGSLQTLTRLCSTGNNYILKGFF